MRVTVAPSGAVDIVTNVLIMRRRQVVHMHETRLVFIDRRPRGLETSSKNVASDMRRRCSAVTAFIKAAAAAAAAAVAVVIDRLSSCRIALCDK